MTQAEYEKTRLAWLTAEFVCAGVEDCMCPRCDPDGLLDRLGDLAAAVGRPVHEHAMDCNCSDQCALETADASKKKYRDRMRRHIP